MPERSDTPLASSSSYDESSLPVRKVAANHTEDTAEFFGERGKHKLADPVAATSSPSPQPTTEPPAAPTPTPTTPTKQPAPPGQAPVQLLSDATPTAPKPNQPPPVGPNISTPPEPVKNYVAPEPATANPNQELNRKKRKQAQSRAKAKALEVRWAQNRLAVPYPTDGPKVSFGVLWFTITLAAVLYSPIAVAAFISIVAGLAGLQTAHAWFKEQPAKWWAAAAAVVISASGLLGPIGLGAGIGMALVLLAVYLMVGLSYHHRTPGQLFDVILRCSVPAGLAGGSIVALTNEEVAAAVGLLLLISAYESGDFLVGSGAQNAFEGPIAGFISLGVMTFFLSTIVPEPYDAVDVIALSLIAAIGALAGQIFASAALPRGVAWAPALRRLDSYIVAAPIWLLLVSFLVRSIETPTA